MKYLVVYFQSIAQLQPIHRWEFTHRPVDIRIIYKKARSFLMEFYDQNRLIWSTSSLSKLDRLVYKKRPALSKTGLCGISADETHCFADSTHRTCCLLGPQARAYADRSGNPIGQASVDSFRRFYGIHPDNSTLTPWCTCIGSGVCSYYASMFDDGTHIKWIDSVLDNQLILSTDEASYRTFSHTTPGIPR